MTLKASSVQRDLGVASLIFLLVNLDHSVVIDPADYSGSIGPGGCHTYVQGLI